MPTRTAGRPSTAGRFGRQQQATAGRFARQQATTGRLSRGQTHKPSTRRSTPTPWLTARKPGSQRSKGNQALNAVASKLPGGLLGKMATSSKSSGGGGKKKAGFALLAGAAGLAMKNRDKLRRGKGEEPTGEAEVFPATTAGTTTPPVASAPEAPVTPVPTAAPEANGGPTA